MTRSLGIAIDQNSSVPIYLQIAEQIIARIKSGALPPGFRLPPTRKLAEELSTHRNTVVRAFEELTAGDYTHSVVGRGTFVSDARADAPRAPAAKSGDGFAWAPLLSQALDGERLLRFDRLARNPPRGDVINLTRMQPSDDLLPHEQLKRCTEHVFRRYGAKALEYAPPQGLPALRQLIAADLQRSGVPASADDVLITTGSQQAIDLVARALVNPGDAFLTEGWTYSGALNALAAAGARVVGVPCDDEGPELGALASLSRGPVKGLYVMPNSRNPTGTSMSRRRREALVSWARRAAVPIIEDDYGADLDLEGRGVPPALRALDANVFHVGTFSKKLIPALRVGFVVCPPSLTHLLVHLKHAMDLGTSALLQYALAEFLERGYLRSHLKRTLPVYRARRDALAESLRQHLPPEVTFAPPSHGVVQWLDLPRGLEAEVVFEEARRRGVLISPGSLYTVGGPGRSGIRLTFCSASETQLRRGAERLGAAIRSVMPRRDPAHYETRGAVAIDLV